MIGTRNSSPSERNATTSHLTYCSFNASWLSSAWFWYQTLHSASFCSSASSILPIKTRRQRRPFSASTRRATFLLRLVPTGRMTGHSAANGFFAFEDCAVTILDHFNYVCL
jgi:hypothetical protein